MLITAIITTYKREQWLARAVNSVLTQGYSENELEVIVVNDSGEPLGEAAWQEDPRVRVFTTFRTERCVARNLGAALSRGKYLHFLDDDDYLLPGAYAALFDRAESTGADWTYGSYNLMNDEGEIFASLLPYARGKVFADAVAGLAIPLGVSLIARPAFFSSGCFDVHMLVQEDTELLMRISLNGKVEFTDAVVANFRSGVTTKSTTQWNLSKQMGILKREKAFAMPGCVSQIHESFAEREYKPTRGKLVRFYAGSSCRHLRNWALLTALSRFLIALRLSFRGVFFRGFWDGLLSKQ